MLTRNCDSEKVKEILELGRDPDVHENMVPHHTSDEDNDQS